MSDIECKILLELIRDGIVVDSIKPYENSEDDFVTFQIDSSVSSFPMFSFQSSNKILNEAFMNYSKNDIVRCSMDHNGDNTYKVIFEGEFFSKEVEYISEPDNLKLDISSIHSFFKLSLFELALEKEFRNMTFETFVRELLQISDINIRINISSDIAILPIFGMSLSTNLFRIFKEVCLMIDAVAIFNCDNTVDIEYRKARLNRIESQEVITIHKKDMKSFTSTNYI